MSLVWASHLKFAHTIHLNGNVLMISVIYAIINIINDKYYVGQAFVKNKRWKNHRIALRTNKHHSKYLQASYNKHGDSAFIFVVLEVVTDATADLLNVREQHWMDFYKSADREHGFNMAPSAGSVLGYKHTDETKLKWSEQRKGKKRSKEFGLSVSARMKGRIVSDEARANMAKAQTGKTQSEETKAKRALTLIGNKRASGVKQSAEHIEARASVIRGKPKSEAHKAKISAGNKGKVISEEARKKMSIAAKGRIVSEETRRKLSEAAKKQWSQA